jgi:hypothetical protein
MNPHTESQFSVEYLTRTRSSLSISISLDLLLKVASLSFINSHKGKTVNIMMNLCYTCEKCSSFVEQTHVTFTIDLSS